MPTSAFSNRISGNLWNSMHLIGNEHTDPPQVLGRDDKTTASHARLLRVGVLYRSWSFLTPAIAAVSGSHTPVSAQIRLTAPISTIATGRDGTARSAWRLSSTHVKRTWAGQQSIKWCSISISSKVILVGSPASCCQSKSCIPYSVTPP